VNIPLITNIQRFSINDGPGIRTTVFFKGCMLKCPWCHNPECINPEQEFYYHQEKCARCGLCVEVCPENAITLPGENGEEYPVRDRNKCNNCMKCVENCPHGALTIVGQYYTKEEIIKEVISDQVFYKRSGGGMTLSGGEVLMFPEFAKELLKEVKEYYIHTCIDTSGFAKWEVLEDLLRYVDLVLLDIKHMDPKMHEKVIGVPNMVILNNARKMAEMGVKMRLRIPVIPGFNDTEENMYKILKFAKELGDSVVGVDILPFHNWAEKKYDQLDLEYKFKGIPSLTREEVEDFEKIFKDNGFDTSIGG